MAEFTSKELLHELQTRTVKNPNPRTKEIVDRIVADLFATIEDLDVQPAEFWAAIRWMNTTGAATQFGLVSAGLGFDRLLDIRMDEADLKAGLALGTPRAIEGPLYIPNAPVCEGEGRLDDGSEEGPVLVMEGVVRDDAGKPLAGAVVDVWHANPEGRYSHFDPSQSEFNFRRRIHTDANGRYRFRSLMPVGYAVPPGSPTEQLLDQLGRHGNRPAHIHFLVTGDGFTPLTTQINIPGDAFLEDDFAYATRDNLIVEMEQRKDGGDAASLGVTGPHTRIQFDFTLQRAAKSVRAAA